MRNYPRYILLAATHNMVETESWMIDGINRKMYFEAFIRAVQGLPSNPGTKAGVMGREAGHKKYLLTQLIKGEEANEENKTLNEAVDDWHHNSYDIRTTGRPFK